MYAVESHNAQELVLIVPLKKAKRKKRRKPVSLVTVYLSLELSDFQISSSASAEGWQYAPWRAKPSVSFDWTAWCVEGEGGRAAEGSCGPQRVLPAVLAVRWRLSGRNLEEVYLRDNDQSKRKSSKSNDFRDFLLIAQSASGDQRSSSIQVNFQRWPCSLLIKSRQPRIIRLWWKSPKQIEKKKPNENKPYERDQKNPKHTYIYIYIKDQMKNKKSLIL